MLNTNAIIFIKRANINISMSGIGLFALISTPCSSLTHCTMGVREGRGLTPAGSTSQLASTCICPIGGTEGDGGVFLPLILYCMWHLPQRWHLHYGFDSSWKAHVGSTFCQVALHPGLQKDGPHPWLSSLRHGSSFLLLLISGCLDFPCLASQLFHYLCSQFLKSFASVKMLSGFPFPSWTLIQPGKTEVYVM